MTSKSLFSLGDCIAALSQPPTSAAVSPGNQTSSQAQVRRVVIDSRRCGKDDLFFALRGQHLNGHDFIVDAGRAGAAAVVCERAWQDQNSAVASCITIGVADTLRALQDLAGWYLKTAAAAATRIAVTGSNGKTTTKEMIGAVLRTGGGTYVAEGNLNSETGVPLAAFDLRRNDSRFAVFELAMNNPNEIRPLAAIVRPDIALITNIGSAHIGRFADTAAIAREKRDIAAYFDGRQTLVVRENDAHRSILEHGVGGTIALFGPTAQRARLESAGDNWLLHLPDGTLRLPLPGEHNAWNALAALRIADLCGIPFGQAREALEGFRAASGRSEVLRGERLVLNDCYNANRESMLAGIRAAAQLARKERAALVLVLGEMGELGAYAEQAHREVLAAARDADCAIVCTVGAGFALADEHPVFNGEPTGATVWLHASDTVGAAKLLEARLRPNQVVLLKGSRAVGLESLVTMARGKVEAPVNA